MTKGLLKSCKTKSERVFILSLLKILLTQINKNPFSLEIKPLTVVLFIVKLDIHSALALSLHILGEFFVETRVARISRWTKPG